MPFSSFDHSQGRQSVGEGRKSLRKQRRETSKKRRLQLEKLVARQLLAADLMGPEEPMMAQVEMAAESKSLEAKTKAVGVEAEVANPAVDYWLLSWDDDFSPHQTYGPSIVASTETTELIDGARLVRFQQPLTGSEVMSHLGLSEQPEMFYALEATQMEHRLTPNDANFFLQYNIHNTGQFGGTAGQDLNLIEVWDTRRGTGSVIGIIDNGVDFGHPDLSGNYRADLSFDFNGNDAIPAPDYTTDFHGTAVAGVAAAVGNNGIGVAGVAYDADFAAIKLTAAATTDAQNAAALNHQMQNIDIYNNAWGPLSNGNIGSAGQPGPLATAALQNGVTNGRGGLGSVYVWAAGNGGAADNVNYDRYANSRHTIAVGAVTNTGAQATYSETGASLLVVAPSNGGGVNTVFTTDINGPNGYSSDGYTQNTPNLRGDIYTGTSASAAAVSGVVALMLQANPNLTSRDVQHILVDTATKNSPADAAWFLNAAGHWVNNKFGFGAVNAGAAVAAAASWTTVGPELVWESTVKNVNLAVPDNNTTGVNVTFGVPDNFKVEYVEVLTETSHTYGGDLVMKLTSPSGTTSDLSALRNFTTNFTFNDVLTTARNWEENSFGTWTLNVSDRFAADVGTLNKAAIRVYGYSIDTALPNLSVANVTVAEADGAMANFEVVLSQASATDVTFNAFTFDGTAIAGSDYTPLVNVPYTIPAGQTTVTVSVPIINDGVEEVNKIFSLGLTNSVGSDPLVRGAVGTIADDDDPAFYTATPLTNIGTAGTLIQQSLNNPVLLISNVDVDDLRFAGVQGQKIGAIARPTSSTAIVTVQLVDSLGNNVGGPAVSPSAGQPAVLPLTSLPASEVFALRITGSDSTVVTTDFMGGAVNEAWGTDTSEGAPVVIDSSFLTLGSGRYAAVGKLVISGGITGIKTGSSTNFVDISGTGTALNLGDDGVVQVVTTIGNSLLPAGNIRISNNGVIVAGSTGDPSWSNDAIPTTAFGQFLAPHWDDLYNNNTNGNVYWQQTTIGGVPALIVQWNNREHYDLGSQTITFQAQIFGSGGTLVRYVYPDVDFQTAGYSFGGSATIGYQINTSNFSQFSRNQSLLANGDQITYQVATDDDAYTIDLSGAVGKKIDVLLTALNGSSLAGVGVDLIAPDGTTVLASASTAPGGFTPTNYGKGILSFTVPAAGVYKIRLNATATADYSLVVTESLAFDTENNNVISNPLRSLDLQTSGYGYASATGTASPDVVDYYSVSLAADDYIIVQTSTPLDGGAPTALDPSISIYSPANALLVSDDNSGTDGRNAFQYFRAPAAGVYKVAVSAVAGTGAYVLDINEWVNRNPSDVALSGDTLAENAGADFEIGTLSSTDPDPGDTFTYGLVSGTGDTDNALFNVSGTSLRATASLDFETKSSYSVRVRSTDQRGGFLDEVFVINLTDVNEIPTDITLSPSEIAENAGTDVVVGTLTTTDVDAGDSFTYAMVSGTGDDDNSVFTLDGDSVKANPSFDFETKSSYTIRVSTTDQGGLVLEKAIVINVTNVNETPTDISLSAASIDENAGANAVVGVLSTTDVDAGNTFTYALVSGTGDDDNGSFNISGDAIRANASFNFEADSSYSVRVSSTDQGGLTVEKTFVITVTDVNDAPSDLNLSSTTIAENAGVDATVGTFSSTDEDPSDTFTYELVSGTGDDDNGAFNISGDELRANASFDFESDTSYSVLVRTTDLGGLTFDKIFTIEVTNVNETPTDISLSAAEIGENAGVNAVVGTLSTTDVDAGDSFTYTLVSGTGDDDNGAFNISGDALRANASFNFEANSSYSVRVLSTDAGGLTVEKAFVITVTDLNEAPTDIALSAAAIAENAGVDAVIGTLSTTDEDGGDTFTYDLVSGTGDDDNGAFNISGNSLRANASFDFEAGSTYSVLIRSTDLGGLTFDKSFVISVTDVNDVPTDIALSTATIAENAGVDAVVGTLSTTDQDGGDTFTYALVSGTGDDDNSAFNISGNSLRANASFDFEANSSYTVRVSTTDQGGLVFEKAFVITVTDANESPTDIDLSASTVVENAVALVAPLAIGNLSTTDVDAGDSHTYSLVAGVGSTDNAIFSIDGGVLSLNSGAVVDFETQPSYSVRVRSTDSGGDSIEEVFTVTVENRGEVSLIEVNSGAAQRSRVTDLKVSFDSEVTIDAGAFVVTKRGAGGGNVPVSFTTALDGLGRTVATISFSGAFVSGGSLVDGNYQLTIDGSLITDQLGARLDGDLDGTAGGNREFGASAVDNFFRMFGDTSGDRTVSLTEFNEFRNTFGRSSGDPLYKQNYDFDNDGSIGLSDFNQFRNRFGTTLLFV